MVFGRKAFVVFAAAVCDVARLSRQVAGHCLAVVDGLLVQFRLARHAVSTLQMVLLCGQVLRVDFRPQSWTQFVCRRCLISDHLKLLTFECLIFKALRVPSRAASFLVIARWHVLSNSVLLPSPS